MIQKMKVQNPSKSSAQYAQRILNKIEQLSMLPTQTERACIRNAEYNFLVILD